MLRTPPALRASLAALLLALCIVTPDARAATVDRTASSRVTIANFGRIDDHYYRGAQPQSGDYRSLATLGIKTVIDLTRNGQTAEARLVDAAGMAFHRIPLTITDRPSRDAIATFLSVVTDPAAQPVFVHCQGGRHRTGVMTAVYRMTQDGWTADQAYAEMKQYQFEGFPDHPVLRQFVYDYFAGAATAGREHGSAVRQIGFGAVQAQAPAIREFTVTAHRHTFTPERIEVKQGEIVKLTLVADDIPHSLTIDAYRISKRASPGQAVTIEFRADQAGTYPFYCSLATEDGCRRMRGELIVR